MREGVPASHQQRDAGAERLMVRRPFTAPLLQSFEPPSTRTVSPVIQRASSDARNATTGPISSARATRGSACMFLADRRPASLLLQLYISGPTTPRATALARTPRWPS